MSNPASLATPRRSALLLLLVAVPACAPKAADTGAKTGEQVPVTVAALAPATLTRTVPVVGTLDPFKDVMLAPKVDGRVLRVARDTGDVVMPGDVLLELDTRDYQLEVEVARRGLEAELARLELTDLPDPAADPEKLVEKVPSVVKAQATLEEAGRKVEQQKTLFDRGVGSKEDYAVVAAERKVAEANLRQTKTESRAALAGTRRLKANLEQAEQRLRDAVLRAPVPDDWAAWAAVVGPGATPLRYTVASRMVWEGEMVRSMPEKNVFRLVIAHVLKLRAAVPEKHAPDVKIGQAVVVRVDAHDHPFPGVVTRVSPTVDTLNRTFQVEVEVPNCDAAARLKPGTFARAEIETRTDTGVLAVPPGAVVTFAGVTKVFVADGDKAKAVEVQLGQRAREWVEVIGPVPPGAKVITSGFSQLVDGSPIRIR
jgi:multidrug efflux pump subunit AcrA (membrane-fusion protein)